MDWYKLYWALPDDNQWGVVGKAINRIGRRYIRSKMNAILPEYYRSHPVDCSINTTEKRDRKIICSLTSFPARIENIWVSIETVMRQTHKPDAIILWLAEPQFPDQKLPESLVRLQYKGLTVRFVDEDLRSHKKYYYVLQEFRDANVILLDDDLYYPDGLIENLVKMSKANPDAICATRVHKMTYKDGYICSYRDWVHNFNSKHEVDDKDLFITSGAGTLIPPHALSDDMFNKEVFRKICFLADDVWLTFQSKKSGTRIVTNNKYDKDEITIPSSQEVKLVNENVISGGNDKQIKAVIEYLNL